MIDSHKKGNWPDLGFDSPDNFLIQFLLSRAKGAREVTYWRVNLTIITHLLTLIIMYMMNKLVLYKNMMLHSHRLCLVSAMRITMKTGLHLTHSCHKKI